MRTFVLLVAFWIVPAHAMAYRDLRRGVTVELVRSLTVNKILSGANLMCRIGLKTVYPKVSIGPYASVSARFFTVVDRDSDPASYSIYLTSDQLPCGCILNLTHFASYLDGAGDEFKSLRAADPAVVREAPSVSSSCASLPDWEKISD